MLRALTISIFFALSLSVKAQKLSAFIQDFPSFDSVVNYFYEHYEPKNCYDCVINFARKPDGWFLLIRRPETIDTPEEIPFWLTNNKFQPIDKFTIKEGESAIKFPQYQSREFTYDSSVQRMFRILTYYGYIGWADDIVRYLEPLKNSLNDADIYSLGRAHSALANGLLSSYPEASRKEKFEFNEIGNSLSKQQVDTFLKYKRNAIECFKIIVERSPLFYDKVGKISTKYANEFMDVYLGLIIYQNEEIAKRAVVQQIYPIEILTNARNYLSNCPHGAILITYSDNDTYPLWYIQITENYRNDISVINSSLLGSSNYVSYLRRKTNNVCVNFSINQHAYKNLQIVVCNEGNDVFDESAFIAWMNDSFNIQRQVNDAFSEIVLRCSLDQKKDSIVVKNHYLYASYFALIDIYISNKERPICITDTNIIPFFIDKNFRSRGIEFVLNSCSKYESEVDTIIDFFRNLNTNGYDKKEHFPFKPGTNDYIDSYFQNKLYWNLLYAMKLAVKTKDLKKYEELEKFWYKYKAEWVVKPNLEEEKQYYEIKESIKN